MSGRGGVGLRVLVAAVGLATAGCAGLGSPGGRSGPGTAPVPPRVVAPGPAAVRVARWTHEVPTPAPREAVLHPAADGAAAVTRFAERFINWTPQSVSGVMHALARESIGQARAATSLAAAQVAGTAEIAQNGIANTGTVEAVAPLRGRRGRFVVVTRERTTATLTNAYDGLAAEWHVTVATVTRLAGGGWVVSGWQPEN